MMPEKTPAWTIVQNYEITERKHKWRDVTVEAVTAENAQHNREGWEDCEGWWPSASYVPTHPHSPYTHPIYLFTAFRGTVSERKFLIVLELKGFEAKG